MNAKVHHKAMNQMAYQGRKAFDISSAKKSAQSLMNSNQNFVNGRKYVYATHEGNRVKNQDRISIQILEINQKVYQYFAVFDGHGGHMTSTYLSTHLHMLIKEALVQEETPENALKNSLKTVE